MYFILAVFASLFVYALAHQQVGVVLPEGESCTDSIPPFQSYHIHALFWSNNANSTKAAEMLLDAFSKEFNLSYENNTCKYNPGNLKETEMCLFETDYQAAGPFLTGNIAVFVPVDKFETTLGFMNKHKGFLDVFAHPNSGCGIQDHVRHAMWMGNKWELDFTIFLD